MPPKLIFVSDTNIWIDFNRVGMLELLFALPFQYCTTDFAELELEEPDAGILREFGLEIRTLEADALLRIEALRALYADPSFTDLSCLVLAEELGCKLLTGDNALRSAAEDQDTVVVHGTLWLLEQMIEHEVITPKEAAIALRAMLTAKARLPKAACEDRLRKWGT